MVTTFVPALIHPPVVTAYVIREVPALIPVTRPVDTPIVATAGESLVHVPPVVELVHVSEAPMHNGVFPLIVWGVGVEMVTVFVAVLIHPPAVVTE